MAKNEFKKPDTRTDKQKHKYVNKLKKTLNKKSAGVGVFAAATATASAKNSSANPETHIYNKKPFAHDADTARNFESQTGAKSTQPEHFPKKPHPKQKHPKCISKGKPNSQETTKNSSSQTSVKSTQAKHKLSKMNSNGKPNRPAPTANFQSKPTHPKRICKGKLNSQATATNFASQTSVKSTPTKHLLPKVTHNEKSNRPAPNQTFPKKTAEGKLKVTSNDNNSRKMNKNNANQQFKENMKKKDKKKKPMTNVAVEPKSSEDPSVFDKGKRKFTQTKTNDDIHAKRLKNEKSGFVNANINTNVKTKISAKKCETIQKKASHNTGNIVECNSGNTTDATDPSVKVFKVDENQLNDLAGHSDSEADSYIDKFFCDDNNEFNENRIYSVDEIETGNRNFLSKASGERTQSDDDTSSSEALLVYSSDSIESSGGGSGSGRVESKSIGKRANTDLDLEKYSWSDGEDSSENTDDSDSDDDDDEDGYDYSRSDMFYGDDSDVSLGSIVDSDDLDDTYECETSEESLNGYEMNSSSDDDDDYDSDQSDRSDYSYSESESSHDTYDEFLNSRHYDSSNDDQDYNDSHYDDVRVAQGTAITYKITDKRIKIFENYIESRIVELPKMDSDDEKCINLIPINVSRSKILRIERQKRTAEQAKLKEIKMKDEAARLAHEKAISDYYNMDHLFGSPLNSHTDDMTNSVSIVKCPKNSNHSNLDWMQVNDDPVQKYDEINLVYPKSKVKKVISIPDNSDVSKRLKKPKTPTKAYGNDVDMEQSSNIAQPDEMETNEGTSMPDNVKATAGNKQRKPSSVQNKRMESQFFNSINSRHVLLLLRNEMHFHGSLHVKLIAGNVIAFGYELQHNKTVTLHSPRGHGLINLIPCPSSDVINQQQHLHALQSLTADFYAQDIDYLTTQMTCTGDAILLLERDQANKGVNMIDRYMRETMFPNINAFNNDSPFYSSEFVLRCKFFTEPDNGLLHNGQWSTIKLRNATKLVTIGGKGVGKSTFIRYLINSNIGKFPKFLFVDLDIGQPELFLPQTLSATVVTEPILGPGYLQNVKPSKAVLFGDVNVLPNPIKYLRCVQDIFAFCLSHSELSSIPWIINTMGYSRGFGSELIACILKILQPSDVVQIQSQSYSDNFVQIMNADTVNTFKFNVFEREMNDTESNCQYKMHIFNAMRGKNCRKHMDMTAKDLRYTLILAKLGNCLKYNSDWLTSVKPFEASLNDLDVLITSGEELNPTDYLDLLNGNLVYLCRRQPEQTSDIIDCHGIGIVRSVDGQTRKLYLLSTIPLAELQHVNVLAIGAIPLPSAVFLNQHMNVRGAVPYVYNSDNFIGSKQVAQHIFRAESKSTNKPIQLMED